MAASQKSRTGEVGFTLLEVIVAITILGIALAAILAAFSQSLMRTHARDRAFAARALASTILAKSDAIEDPALGTTNGHSNDGFSWTVNVAPYGDGSVHAPHLVRLTATVNWPGEIRPQTFSLSTLKLAGARP
jgi:general secretion pathway protein I